MVYFKSRDSKVCNGFVSEKERLKKVKTIDSGRESL